MVTVQRVRSCDGADLRALRLRALKDTPAAFASTYALEATYDPTEWSRRATAAADGDQVAFFLAKAEGDLVGIIGGYRTSPTATVVELISMWVDRDTRRRGVGVALVNAVVSWARDIGATAVELWVTVGNDRAQHLYERCAFVELGQYQALPSDPCKNETRMRLELSSAGAACLGAE